MSKLILAGKTTATMAQSPFKMTNLGILAAVNSILGKPYVKIIDTGVTLGDEGQRLAVHGSLAVTETAGGARHSPAGAGPAQLRVLSQRSCSGTSGGTMTDESPGRRTVVVDSHIHFWDTRTSGLPLAARDPES